MFNQIKQEYVYARYLCFNSIESDSVHYADENVDLIDCLDTYNTLSELKD